MSQTAFFVWTVVIVGLIETSIFFVVFGQITVRRLRKNPETAGALGAVFISGWDIMSVAYTLSVPRSLARKMDKIAPWYFANSELIYRHTTRLDRVLGRIFAYSQTLTVILLLSLIVLKEFDISL